MQHVTALMATFKDSLEVCRSVISADAVRLLRAMLAD